jgi:hypothetical protein
MNPYLRKKKKSPGKPRPTAAAWAELPGCLAGTDTRHHHHPVAWQRVPNGPAASSPTSVVYKSGAAHGAQATSEQR